MVLHLYIMGFIQIECYIIRTVESQTPLKQISVEHKLVLKHYLITSDHKNTFCGSLACNFEFLYSNRYASEGITQCEIFGVVVYT